MKKNMKKNKILVLLIIVLILFNNVTVSTARNFKFYIDTFDHWAFDTIMWATNEIELFNGYEDGTFKPDNNIKISEYITLLDRAVKLRGIEYEDNTIKEYDFFTNEYFSDLKGNYWAYEQILRVMNYIDRRDSNIKFKNIFVEERLNPNRYITREEAVILSSFFASVPINDNELNFKDIKTNYRYYDQLRKLVNNEIIEGYEDNTFKPNSYITRAESAVILKKLYTDMEYLKDKYLQEISLLDNPKYKKHMLFGDYSNRELTINDKLYRRAVSTLEYLSIINYIPYEERHLYDANPIVTLKTLRENKYWNVVGVNYYLISHNTEGIDYKVAYNELLEDYLIRNDIKDDESLVLFGTNLEILTTNIDIVISALDKWGQNSETDKSKYNSLFIMSNIYLDNGDIEKALKLYGDDRIDMEILEYKQKSIEYNDNNNTNASNIEIDMNLLEKNQDEYITNESTEEQNFNNFNTEIVVNENKIDQEVIKYFIMNKAYILLKSNRFKETEEILRDGWEYLETKEYDNEFIGAIKKVLTNSKMTQESMKL